MTQRHKWADVIIAMANGEPVECQWSDGTWNDPCINNPFTHHIANWRIKPKTIMIGDMEVPEPLRGEPDKGAAIFVVSLHVPPTKMIWGENVNEDDWLIRGTCHSTFDAAEIHSKALIKISGGTV